MSQPEHIEFKIVKIESQKPKIGELSSKSVVYIVPVTDKTCDMYVSDPDGQVRLVSSHVPIFATTAQAYTGVFPENRYIGKTVLIGLPGSYEEYWWIDGLGNTDLVKKDEEVDLSSYYDQQQVDGLLDDKVGKTGDEDIAGKKIFQSVPEAGEDAVKPNDLIRKSQWDAYNTSAETLITQGLAGKEDKSNKKTDIEANKTSNIFYPSIKAVYDWVVAKFNGVTPTVTASVDTSYNIDIATQTEHWNLSMIKNTDFDFTNMFDSGYSKVITITLEGDYAFTFPSWLKPLETNDYYDTAQGVLVAEIVINIKNGGTNPSGYYSLEMIDYAL